MKKTKKITPIIIPLGIVFILSFFFFSFKNVYATTLIKQQIHSSYQYDFGANIIQELGTNLPSGTINGISFYIQATSTGGTYNVTLLRCDSAFTGTSCASGGLSSQSINYSFQNNFQGIITGSITSTTTIASKYYAIQLGTSVATNIGGSINNVYPEGQCENNAGNQCSTTKDLFFIVGEDLSPPINENYIALTYPQNNSILQGPLYWGIQYNVATTTFPGTLIPESNILVQVRFGSTTPFTSASYTDGYDLFQIGYASTTLAHVGSLPIGDWYAQAALVGLNTATQTFYDIATSTTILFSSLVEEPGLPPLTIGSLPTFFATSTGNIFDQCEQILGSDNSFLNFWGAGFCRASRFLFEPHQFVFDAIGETISLYKSIFPFNVFFDINAITSRSLENTIGQAQQTITWTPVILNTQFSAITLISSSTLSNLIGETNKNWFFTFITSAVWAFVGIKIFSHFT